LAARAFRAATTSRKLPSLVEHRTVGIKRIDVVVLTVETLIRQIPAAVEFAGIAVFAGASKLLNSTRGVTPVYGITSDICVPVPAVRLSRFRAA
jgi:hypothetical protein